MKRIAVLILAGGVLAFARCPDVSEVTTEPAETEPKSEPPELSSDCLPVEVETIGDLNRRMKRVIGFLKAGAIAYRLPGAEEVYVVAAEMGGSLMDPPGPAPGPPAIFHIHGSLIDPDTIFAVEPLAPNVSTWPEANDVKITDPGPQNAIACFEASL